jgi:hypothetical protein
MTFILPRGAEREYLTVYGIVAIYVVELPTGETMLGISRDLFQSLLSLRRRYAGAAIVCAYWAKEAAEAQLVCREVARGSKDVLMNARTVQARIETAAARVNIALTDHETIMTRVRMAVEYVDGKIAEAQAAGDLRWFNRTFREWRLEANARGRTMSYAEARARLRRAIYRQILFSECCEIGSMPTVFPKLDMTLDSLEK